MENHDIIQNFQASLGDLLHYDHFLLSHDANERPIANRLAFHLTHHFSEWDVDCEYNLFGVAGRKLINKSFDEFTKAVNEQRVHQPINSPDDLLAIEPFTRFYPDIIVHQRGSGMVNNLLAVEVKKEGAGEILKQWDEYRICYLVKELKYQQGICLIINTGLEITDPMEVFAYNVFPV